ncbi:radical SAM protein [Papillibacter cinnamivorans]|uniref:4Fe-4S single cluster domain-containing protein n=1 Tax=Papillibacter cinnamivorans DSM 12816 TaxID=1122930 RepID=A0A1W2CF72_9FIRM|nr:radical SAM protein [Papillibacter cinnamivorans]SMC83716.1 4Fe-4S single cluster domain-containing protein [Papillibacter cinnamivorans DSM 12816]
MTDLDTLKRILWITCPDRIQSIRPRFLRRIVKLLRLPGFLIKNPWILKRSPLILPYIEMPVTTRCTLRCEKCANLMQWYRRPEDVECPDLIRYFNRLVSVVDYTVAFTFLGGEPLLYPRLGELLEHAVYCDKIGIVKVTTNGTILPTEERLLAILAHPKVFVEISDYGDLSRRKSELISLFEKRRIRYVFFRAQENWYDFGGMEFRAREETALRKQFALCAAGCRSYYRGRLHWCPRSGHGMELGFIPDTPGDYVDLMDPDLSTGELRIKIRAFCSLDGITACNYCDKGTDLFLPVPAAVQMEQGKDRLGSEP